MSMKNEARVLPAAVITADDPRSPDFARVVPIGADITRVGRCVLGYTKAPTGGLAPNQAQQKFTLIEMTGRCYRKALRALVILRREDGVVIEDFAAWLTVAADIAAAIFGPRVTAANVEGQCAFMGIDVGRAAVVPFHARAAQWRCADTYAPLTGDDVGRLVQLSWRERDALLERNVGSASRLGSFDETTAERRKRMDRDRKAGQRAETRSPRPPKPWEVLGMKKTTYYRHLSSGTDSVRSSLKEGKVDKTSPTPGNADKNSPTFGPPIPDDRDSMGNADKTSPTMVEGGGT